MTVVTALKISEEGLRHYTIVFEPKSNERFFQDYFYQLSGRQIDELFGYNKSKARGSVGKCSADAIKNGRYPAFRIRLMCKNSKGKIEADAIRSDYDHTVERRSSFYFKVDENTENAVWNAICDGL